MNYPINLSNIILKCNTIMYKSLKEVLFYTNDINCSKLSKGYVGYIVEKFFHSSFSNKPICDIPNLGIEIKTIPLNLNNDLSNNVFICSFNPNLISLNFVESTLYHKTKNILFVPYYNYEKNILKYKFLKPFFYKMDDYDKLIIEKDWKNIVSSFYNGEFNRAKYVGKYIKFISHAKSKIDLVTFFDFFGDKKNTSRMSFYFNKIFIKHLIKNFSYFY